MPFDGITIHALAQELNSDLCRSRIDKIHQPEKDEIVLSIRHPQAGNLKLVLCANAKWARMHTTTRRSSNPAVPPNFCMVLRKYIEGGKIKSIKQIGLDRIIHITIEALDEFRDWKDKILICEFMGKHSNIILVNPETGMIIDAIKIYGSDKSSYREVLPGKKYITPPAQDKIDLTVTDFDQFCTAMWQQSGNLAPALFKVCSGLSPISARQLCENSGLDPDLPVDQCGQYEFTTIYNFIRNLLQSIDEDNFTPCVLSDQNGAMDFFAYALPTTAETTLSVYPSINTAADKFYTDKLEQVHLNSVKANIVRRIRILLDKGYKKKMRQEKDLHNARDNEKYRNWGELLTAYAYLYKKGDQQAILTDFYSGEEVTIPLDPRYTPIGNAQHYFKTYNKSKRAISHLEHLLALNQTELDYLETVVLAINQADSTADLEEIIYELEKGGYTTSSSRDRKKKAFTSQPRRFISADGLEILVGRNNYQNDALTLKQSDRSDLWLHTKNIPGSHVIVRLPGTIKDIDDIPDSTLVEAASLAAYFSQARESDKVPVDYTFRGNVRKPSGSKPGKVIYDNYWTIIVNPQTAKAKNMPEG